MRPFPSLALLVSLNFTSPAAPVFQDGFESGALATPWTTDRTHSGRVSVQTEFEPQSGQHHLVLDDEVNDAVSSVAEATLTLDLTRKQNVVVSFQAKSLGNEPDPPPIGAFTGTRTFDAVTLSLDGGVTWRSVHPLTGLGTTWTSVSIALDPIVAAAGGTYGPDVKLRFSGYDNSPAPLDGIAIDNVLVEAENEQRTSLELPGSSFAEGSGPHAGFVVISNAPAAPLILTLSAQPSGLLVMPPSVTIPAGETAASFAFSVTDDAVFNLTRTLSLSATAPGVIASASQISITDNEAPKTVLILPSQVTEGDAASTNASVRMDIVPSIPVRFNLSSSPIGQVSFLTSVTIQPGQTQVHFSVRAINDTSIENPQTITMRAAADGLPAAIADLEVLDNEPRTIELTGSGSLYEGETSSATITLGGRVPADLVIGLESIPAGQIELAGPAIVRAGQSQATLQLRGIQNSIPQPSRSVQLKITASGFSANPVGWVVYDDDVAWYAFDTLPDALQAGSERRFSVRAMDVDGNKISEFRESVKLEAELPDGSVLPLTAAPVPFLNGEWSGAVTVPQAPVSPVRLRAIDALGRRGVSNYFEVFRTLSLKTVDQVWDPSRGRLYASVSTTDGGPHANGVVAIDPQSLQVVASVKTDHSPSRLAISGNGERLYAALNDNGHIAIINPADFTVLSTFPVGTSTWYGTLFAGDMVVATGQPDLLVTLREQRGAAPRPNSVAAYRDGVLLPSFTTEDELVCHSIEPSPDPSLLFAYHYNGPTAMRTLRLSENGVAWQDTFAHPDLGYALDFRTAGSTAILGSGQLVNGFTGQILGMLADANYGGHVAADPSRDLAFMLHRGWASFDHFQYLSSYDTKSLNRRRGLFFQSPFYLASSLLRWGAHGLAWRSSDAIVLLNSVALVPESATADVGVRIDIDPYPSTRTAPHPHVVRITNHGPDAAKSVVVDTEIFGNNDPQNIIVSQGVADRRATRLTAALGDLAPGQTATLQFTVFPTVQPSTISRVTVDSHAFDANYGNNLAYRLTVGEIRLTPNAIQPSLEIAGENLAYDPGRRRLWTTLRFPGPDPDEAALISVDPLTGRVFEASSFIGTPMSGTMALSANGRYLYLGRADASEVMRFNLEENPPTWATIPIKDPDGSSQRAADIEVLDGDGTSFLVSDPERRPPRVYDGLVPRAKAATEELVNKIARTGLPGIFAGLHSNNDPYELTRLTVTADGVTASHRLANAGETGGDLVAAGPWVLTTSGRLFDITVPALVRNFGIQGRPCLDAASRRAFFVSRTALHGYDGETGASLGSLPMQSPSTVYWASDCVRWGLDGFAVVGERQLFLGRWEQSMAADTDTNANKIPDRWEASNLGPFGDDLTGDPDHDGLPSVMEYVLGTPAGQSTADPRQVNVTEQGLVRLVFPRRAGLESDWYSYQAAVQLDAWSTVTPVSETVLSTQTIDGVSVETVEALLELPEGESGYVRLATPAR